MNTALSNKIAAFSFICMCLIVWLHLFIVQDDMAFLWFVRQSQRVTGIAVPYFFVISGWFLARHMDESGWWHRELMKGLRSLGIPFLCWLLISGVVIGGLKFLGNMHYHRPLTTDIITGWSTLKWLALWPVSAPPLGILWYVRMLLILVLLSPVIRFLVVKFKLVWILCVYVAWIADFTLIPSGSNWSEFLYYGFSLVGLLFFSIGVYIRYYAANFKWLPNPYAVLILGLVGQYSTTAPGWQALFIPMMLYGAWGSIGNIKLPAVIAQSNFTIFMTHMMTLLVFEIVFKPYLHLPLFVIADFLFAVVVGVLFSYVLHRWFPRMSRILLGGR